MQQVMEIYLIAHRIISVHPFPQAVFWFDISELPSSKENALGKLQGHLYCL